MTTARSLLVTPGSDACYHCVQRCVRRAFLCGIDRYSGKSFEHRRAWIEERLHYLGACFAIAIHAYAVTSNHLHVVVQVDSAAASTWTDDEVVARWLQLGYSAHEKPAFRLMGSHGSGPWEASDGRWLSVEVGV